jgi:hypothetical protein
MSVARGNLERQLNLMFFFLVIATVKKRVFILLLVNLSFSGQEFSGYVQQMAFGIDRVKEWH